MCVHPDWENAEQVGKTPIFITGASNFGGEVPGLVGLVIGESHWDYETDTVVTNYDAASAWDQGIRLDVDGMTALRDELDRRLALAAHPSAA